MLYTGLDLHKSFSYITIMNDRGEVIGQKKLPSNGEILNFLKGFEDSMEVAIEATPSWYWLYDCLEDEGFEVKLSHPLRTKAIAYAKVKTDKVDSATLAHLLRSNLLPLSYVPEKPVRLNRELLRYRASPRRYSPFSGSLATAISNSGMAISHCFLTEYMKPRM